MVLCPYGFLVLWFSGSMVFRFCGSRFSSSSVLWIFTYLVPWLLPFDFPVLWFSGFPISMVLWFFGTLVLWSYFSPVL